MACQPCEAWAKPATRRHPDGCASSMPLGLRYDVGSGHDLAPGTGFAPGHRPDHNGGEARIAGRLCFVFVLALLLTSLTAIGAWAKGDEPGMGETVTHYLAPGMLQSLFPGAD